MTQPASVTSDGMVLVLWVPTIADPTDPTAIELNDPAVLPLSCYLTDEGWDPTVTEDAATDNRLCSIKNFQRPGRETTQITLMYVYNPANPTQDEARLTLLNRTEGFLVARWGVEYEDTVATSDIVDVAPVQLGVQVKQKPTANTPLVIKQTAYVIAPGVQRDVVVSAS